MNSVSRLSVPAAPPHPLVPASLQAPYHMMLMQIPTMSSRIISASPSAIRAVLSVLLPPLQVQMIPILFSRIPGKFLPPQQHLRPSSMSRSRRLRQILWHPLPLLSTCLVVKRARRSLNRLRSKHSMKTCLRLGLRLSKVVGKPWTSRSPSSSGRRQLRRHTPLQTSGSQALTSHYPMSRLTPCSLMRFVRVSGSLWVATSDLTLSLRTTYPRRGVPTSSRQPHQADGCEHTFISYSGACTDTYSQSIHCVLLLSSFAFCFRFLLLHFGSHTMRRTHPPYHIIFCTFNLNFFILCVKPGAVSYPSLFCWCVYIHKILYNSISLVLIVGYSWQSRDSRPASEQDGGVTL